MKYSTTLERTTVHEATVEFDADSQKEAELISENLWYRLDNESHVIRPESMEKLVLRLVDECHDAWELESENFEVYSTNEGEL